MPVASSSFAFDGPQQPDGSRLVVESFQLANGLGIIQSRYFAPKDFDPSLTIAVRSAALDAQLGLAEQIANMDLDGAPDLREQSMTEFLRAMRAAYRASTRSETCRLARWLLRRIAAGQITDAQCQTAFNRTANQWANFKANTLQPQSDAWDAVLAATGA
jgi:hypothetical protein